jgi:Flp pilus assembly protein TadG
MNSARRHQDGQVIALFCLAMLVVLGFAALAVDIGFLYATRRNMQTAADAAAIAGSNALNSGESLDTAKSAAKDVASLNGYADGTNSVSVNVKSPPANPPNPTDGTYVEVDVTKPVQTYFMRALGYNTVSVSTTAIAGFAPAPDCVLALDKTAQNALVASGGSKLTTTCGVVVDSNSSSGLVVSGGSTLDAGSVGVVASTETQASSGVTPPYVPNITSVPDPLASVTQPTMGACNALTANGHGYTATNGATISQGTYCGGITVSGGNTLNLNPGTYILVGGGLQVNGSSNLIGNGVTFFNTVWVTGNPAGNNVGNANQYKPVVFSGGSTTNLTAPTTGALKGILFFQDRNLPSNDKGPSGPQNTISGGSGAVFSGAVYFPSTPLVFSGGSAVNPENVSLIGDTVTISGASAYVGPPTGPSYTPPITASRLYE